MSLQAINENQLRAELIESFLDQDISGGLDIAFSFDTTGSITIFYILLSQSLIHGRHATPLGYCQETSKRCF